MPFGDPSNPYIPGYGRARKPRPDINKPKATTRAPSYASHTGSNAPPSSGSSTSSSSAHSRPKRQTASRSSSSGLTSLAANYLMSGLTDLLTPDPDQAEYSLSSELGSALQKLSSDAEALDRRLGEPLSRNPRDPFGRRSLGHLSLPQMLRAAQKGTAQVNRAGKITIPATRQAARQLTSARQEAADSRKFGGRIPGLDPHQTQVLKTVLRQGERLGATPKEKLAAVETGLVESNLRNLGYGDRDSEGWRQERSGEPRYFNPRNVKASAARFFEESVSDTGGTRGAGMSAGQLAQTIQASAHPERYDERGAEAQGILRAYEQGRKPDPVAAERLKQTKAQAQSLGIPTKARRQPGQPGDQPRKTPTIIQVGNIAQNRFGLRVGEHPHFDQVDPVHTAGSFHYSGQAIDVSGDAPKLAAFNKFVASRFGDQLAEMFYDPGVNVDNGQPTGPIGGHGSHVHVAIDEPGTPAHGLATAAYGLSGGQPVGYYGSGDSPQAAQASAQRARQSVFGGITSIDAPTAAQAPLPEAFEQFQGGGEAEGEAEDVASIIQNILRGRRL